jgi:hypothetical protein
MRHAAATLVPLALIVVACGPAQRSAGGEGPTITSIPPSKVTTKIVGGTPKQEEILREILAGIGGSEFAQVEVQANEEDPGSVDLVVPYEPEGEMHAEWEAWIVAHAFAARSQELGLPPVAQLVPTGRDVVYAEILGEPPKRQPLSAAVALRRAEEAGQTAELFGAQVRRIEVLEPDGVAFSIELQVNGDEAYFLREGLPRVLDSFGESPDPVDAGDFSVVKDSRGRRIWEGAVASLGDSITITDWATPSLQGCYWPHSGPPPGKAPLRCEGEEPLPKIVGASPKQEAVLREILAGIGRTRVETVEVARAAENMPGPADAVQLKMRVPRDDRIANWHMELIANAFGARSRELGLPPVVFVSGDSGGEALVPDPNAATGRELTLAEAREIAVRIREAAARHDAKVRRLQLIRPRRFAFVLELQTDDPAEFLLTGFEDVVRPLDELGTSGYDGRSVEVIDREGKFVLGSGGWFSVRRDLEACAPVLSGFDTHPPPCPAK